MKARIKQIPLIRDLYQQLSKSRHKHRFAHDGYGSFLGVFETFEQAIESAPKTKNIGYDSAVLAQEYAQMLEDNNWEGSGRVIASYDYPVLFWLNKIINQDSSVFDFGGNVGIHFYAYRNYINAIKDLQWTICEVPEIAKIGKAIAQKRSIPNLSFTSKFNDIQDKDILIASGSIQYMHNLAQQLSLNSPQHLLINRLPLYDGEQFVTLQNGGRVFYPQYVFNKSSFIADLECLGYKMIDIWEDKIDCCIIPFHPEKSVPFYSGLYLQLGS
jgi:putative methyltransferase (TIGR04325 family)